MTIALSLALIVKIIIFLFLSGFAALITLTPINDSPISKTQVAIFLVVEVILLCVTFGFLSFTVVA